MELFYLHIGYSVASHPFRNSSWKCRAMVVVKHFIFLLYCFKSETNKRMPSSSAKVLEKYAGPFTSLVVPCLFPKEQNDQQHFSYTADKNRSSNQ